MYRDEARNFYYDITISTPDGKKSARLTDTLLQQCTQADIVEAVASEEMGQGSSSLTLSFIEADFLPDDLNKRPIEGTQGRGYTTNRTGALIDIRFDGEKGFTYITLEELQSGLTRSSRTRSGEREPVAFMFSHNNIVDITWGHLEPRTSRSRRFKIGTINYSTGAGGASLNLQCYNLQKDLARLKLSEGKVWTDKQDVPLSLKQTVYSIARVFNARLEFDEVEVTAQEMENYQPPSDFKIERITRGGDTKVSDNDRPLYLMRSQTIDYWLKDLAREYNSEYEVFEDPLTGVPVIKFTARKLRYSKVVQTLNYRDPDGIMLEFQYNTVAGEASKSASTSAISEDGKAESLYQEVELTDARDVEFKAKTFDPVPLVYNSRAREILQRDLVGESTTTPSTSKGSVSGDALVSAYNKSFMGFITVKTIGHPDLEPGVMKIEGVGIRASTTYRFFQVQHSLGTAGYTCTMQGKTQETVEQGIDNQEQLKENQEYLTTRLSTGQE